MNSCNVMIFITEVTMHTVDYTQLKHFYPVMTPEGGLLWALHFYSQIGFAGINDPSVTLS